MTKSTKPAVVKSASTKRRETIQKEAVKEVLTHACASCGNKTTEAGLDKNRPAVCVKCRNASVEKIVS